MAGFPRSYGWALMLGGLGLLVVGAALEANYALGADAARAYGSGGDELARLLFVPWALGLVFGGYYVAHPEVLWGRGNGRRVAATYLLFTDGAIHTLAIGEHIDLPVVVFFLVLAPLEWAGALLVLRGRPRYLAAWMAGAVGLIALFIVSRLVALPFVTQNLYYRFEPIGLLSKTVEVLFAAAVARELWASRRAARRAVPTPPVTQS